MFCGKQNSLEVWKRGTGNRERKQASASTDITEDEPKQQASFSPRQRAFQSSKSFSAPFVFDLGISRARILPMKNRK